MNFLQNNSILNLKNEFNLPIVTRIFFVVVILYTALITAWVGDDAQITFRIVWNFINGDGITFNFGERVHAFTHPLWFLVLSSVSFFSKKLFLTSIGLNVLFSILAVFMLFRTEIVLCKDKLLSVSPVYFLIFSSAFCDYMTSGLENSLSFFLVSLLFYHLSLHPLQNYLARIYLILALLVLNRLEYVILFLPLAIVLLFTVSSLKSAVQKIWLGFLLILLWMIFSTIYFGSPLPNTFYAKLSAGIPIRIMLEKGWIYISSIRYDPASLVLILTGIILSWFGRSRILIALSIGQFLYFLYVVRIGGDFMLGRFFAVPVFIAVGQILFAVSVMNFGNFLSKQKIYFTLLLLLIFFGAIRGYPFVSGTNYTPKLSELSKLGFIENERGHNYRITGLFSAQRDSWPQINDQISYRPSKYSTTCSLLGGISIFNKQNYIIDLCGLSDPFLSRIKAVETENWRPGHNFRKLPTDYGEFLIGNVESIPDLELGDLLFDVDLMARGVIFSKERFEAIWRVNSGKYSDLNFEQYTNPEIFIPTTSVVEHKIIDSWDRSLDYSLVSAIFGDFKLLRFNNSLKIISILPKFSDKIEFTLDAQHKYEIYVNGEMVETIGKNSNDRSSARFENYNITFIEPRLIQTIKFKAIEAFHELEVDWHGLTRLSVN